MGVVRAASAASAARARAGVRVRGEGLECRLRRTKFVR